MESPASKRIKTNPSPLHNLKYDISNIQSHLNSISLLIASLINENNKDNNKTNNNGQDITMWIEEKVKNVATQVKEINGYMERAIIRRRYNDTSQVYTLVF